MRQGRHNQRCSVIALEEKRVVLAEPAFRRREAGAVLAGFAFGDQRRRLAASADVKVVAAVAEAARTHSG